MPFNNKTYAKITLTTAILLTILLLAISCKECLTEPENHSIPDTTSHHFAWEIDTLGNYGSYLHDVWIVDEYDIWVVGNIVVPDPDSSWNGTGRETFNAAKWDGEKWKYIHIRGTLSNDVGPLYSLWYFSENNIWVTDYCYPIHWDGKTWTLYHLQNLGLDACAGFGIWASSPDDIYFVGYQGSIVHYDGLIFTKVESQTDIDLLDIWGTYGYNIWACGKNDWSSIILHSNVNLWSTFYQRRSDTNEWELPKDEILLNIASIWDSGEGDSLWAVGSWGVFRVSRKHPGKARWAYPRRWDSPGEYEMGYPLKVRGTADNNLFVVGQRSTVLHFNGKSWYRYMDLYWDVVALKGSDNIWFWSLAVTEDLIVIVSDENIILRGRKIN